MMSKPIQLDDMPHMAEARSVEDDWAGISDLAARKKRQNRLNQRALRRRRKAGKTSANPPNEAEKAVPIRPALPLTIQRQADRNIGHSSNTTNPDISNSSTAGWQPLVGRAEHQTTDSARQSMSPRGASDSPHREFRWSSDGEGPVLVVSIGPTTVVLDLCSNPLPADHLLTLVRYNLYRACATNAKLLGIEPRSLHDDIISPFCELKTFDYPLPKSLLPTETQVTVRHHPYIDLFPFGSLRDKLIYSQEIIDEDELCADLGGKNATGEPTGLIVWGDPWDPMGWEISEYVATKWGRLFGACEQLLAATDYWRKRRGEAPLMDVISRRR
ncbi:hypothetical protein GGR51DRAFT_540892 [Nemania sp. FL0031]|nr:hypothetical protein GGR51DRAFT_540892 [Nemania sp. FL0031]